MSDEKKYRRYSAEDIEKYHKGLLSPKEMHDLEKAALDDPFLAEAIEGYSGRADHIFSDLNELKGRLKEKIEKAKVVSIAEPSGFKWRRVAAAVIVLGGLGFLALWISNNGKGKSIAKVEEKRKDDTTRASVVSPPPNDSNNLLNETVKVQTENKPVTHDEKNFKNKAVDTAVDKKNRDKGSIVESSRRVSLEYKKENQDSSKMLKSGIGNSAPSPAATDDRSDQANRVYAPMKKEMTLNNQEHVNYFRGRVVDASNNPLPFANVTSTRYSVGTYADAQGNFTLISGDSSLDVQVRSVGFANGYAQLKSNVSANKIILNDDKAIADRVISNQKRDTSLARGTFKLEEPEPADGWSNYVTYLANNINVPDDLKLNPNRGQVELSFDVTKDGDPVNFKIEKSLCQKCDEEAIRLIKEGPKWKKKNKKAKRATVAVPFNSQH